jgi:hypothetical protein
MTKQLSGRQFPRKIAAVSAYNGLYRRAARHFRTHRKSAPMVYSFLGAAIPERQVALSSRHFKLLRAGSC